MQSTMPRGRLRDRVGTAGLAAGVLALLLTACGGQAATDPAQDESTGNAETSTSPETSDERYAAQTFIDSFENEGLACTEVDPFGDTVVAQFNCEGDDHLVMTIRNFEDENARDDQLDRVQSLACEIADSGQDIQRLATVDTWILMAGGDRDIDFTVFGNAMTTLGLESTDYTCES